MRGAAYLLDGDARVGASAGDTIEWGGRMAAGVMVIVPSLIFFLLASGRIARGLAAGAVKG